MHLGILALGCGKPAFIIEYNGVKAKGQLSHWQLEEELLINPQNIYLLSDKFNYLESNYNYITSVISKNKQKVLNMSLNSFKILSKFNEKEKLKKNTKEKHYFLRYLIKSSKTIFMNKLRNLHNKFKMKK